MSVISLEEKKNKLKKTKIISFVNQKGGVGKTTSCHNIGAGLSSCGFKCLLIDADPQGSLTISAGLRDVSQDKTLYEVLKGENINKAIINRKTGKSEYDILPSDARLSAYNNMEQTKLQKALRQLDKKYDYILIDCPPTLGILTILALVASNEVIAPVETKYLALTGVSQLLDTIDALRADLNPELTLRGIIATFYDTRVGLSNAVLESLQDVFKDKVYKTLIKSNTKLAEAPSYGLNIFEYSPKSAGAKMYKELVDEIIQQEN